MFKLFKDKKQESVESKYYKISLPLVGENNVQSVEYDNKGTKENVMIYAMYTNKELKELVTGIPLMVSGILTKDLNEYSLKELESLNSNYLLCSNLTEVGEIEVAKSLTKLKEAKAISFYCGKIDELYKKQSGNIATMKRRFSELQDEEKFWEENSGKIIKEIMREYNRKI